VRAVFTTLFASVCSKFNISVPVLGSNGSANGTKVTTVTSPSLPNSTVEPFVGAAREVFVGKHAAWMGSGLVCFVVMAVLM
jgi:hypothetical protein